VSAPRLRVAVTGAAGFLGSHLAARYRDLGAEVVALDLVAPALDGVTWVPCDVTADGPAWAALDGLDVVVHTAAIVAEVGDPSRFVAVNVAGSRRAAHAAARQGVGRFVHVSSTTVYGASCAPGSMTAEDAPLVPTGGLYTDTKIAAEHAVLHVAAEHGLAVTVVRPGDIYGVRSQPWIERPLALAARGLLPLVDGGRWWLSPTHVDDVVDGIIRAAAAPHAAGRAYNLAGPPVPVRDFFGHHARHLGVSLPSLPRAVVRALGVGAEVGARWLGGTPPFAASSLEYVTHAGGYASDRAREELGWEPRVPLEDGLARTLAAYPFVPLPRWRTRGRRAMLGRLAGRTTADGADGAAGSSDG
jgi:2-alkyl-3-oxoalkanoate reductase